MSFGGGADVLVIEPNAVVAGTLSGFTKLDTIDLAKTSATSAWFSGTTANGTLTVMNGTATVGDTFGWSGTFTANGFTVSPDGTAASISRSSNRSAT